MIRRPYRRPAFRGRKGQALVEFAVVLPLFAMLVFVTIELSLLFVAYYSETRMARETARWLAINSSATDAQVATQVQNTMLPGLVNGTPALCNPLTTCSFTTDTVYTVGQMTVTFTPCGAVSAPCPQTNRASGATLYVQMSYNVANLLFLPTTFHIGSLTTSLPTSLPAYKISLMTE